MSECPDSCEGREICGCGEREQSGPLSMINKQLERIVRESKELQKMFSDTLNKKTDENLAKGDLMVARAEIAFRKHKIESALTTVSRELERRYIEMHVALGGLRNE